MGNFGFTNSNSNQLPSVTVVKRQRSVFRNTAIPIFDYIDEEHGAGLSGLDKTLANFATSSGGQALGVISDISTIAILGIILWFGFPLLRPLRSKLAHKLGG